MTKADLAREYRKKHGMEMATKKLARIMYNENNLLFKDLEAARDALKYIEGKKGIGDAKKVIKTEFYMKEQRPINPYDLPKSKSKPRQILKLPIACNNILVISDLHIPYHDVDAITIALDYAKKNKVNTIFINGDLIDMALVSKYDKDLSKEKVKTEFDLTKHFLKSLRKSFPKAEIYWAKGNHCIRWEKFLMQKVSEIWDDEYFTLESRLSLNEERIHLIDDKTIVKMGKLTVVHGHHVFRGVFVPVSPARGAFLKAKQSVLVGHLHRSSHHPEINMDGKVISCWSSGCLCELFPSYSPQVSNWQHGFTHVLVEKNGDYTVKNYQIINGKIH